MLAFPSPALIQQERCSHLLAKLIPNLIQILRLQENSRRQFLKQLLVPRMIMQREETLDAFPLSTFGRDACSTF